LRLSIELCNSERLFCLDGSAVTSSLFIGSLTSTKHENIIDGEGCLCV